MPIRSFLPTGLTQIKRKSLWKPHQPRIPNQPPLKQKWQIQAETKFLQDRKQAPDCYINNLSAVHLLNVSPLLRNQIHLRNSRMRDISAARARLMRQQVCLSEFETTSPSARIVNLTEKILTIRAHILRSPHDKSCHRGMMLALGARHRAMKSLYQADFELYQHTCKIANIAFVKFSIPDSRDPSKSISLIGTDGERARFLIRQRCWKGRKNLPKKIKINGKIIQPTRHSLEPVPKDFNQPIKFSNFVNNSWPYGIRQTYIRGEYSIRNPTAPGQHYVSVPLAF